MSSTFLHFLKVFLQQADIEAPDCSRLADGAQPILTGSDVPYMFMAHHTLSLKKHN
jgi:hypothetical protein